MTTSHPKPRIHYQDRDFSILHCLLHTRLLTIRHSAALHFGGSYSYAKQRLRRLHAAGLVAKRATKVHEPTIYSLTAAGFQLLKVHGRLGHCAHLIWTSAMRRRAQVSKHTLEHELSVLDVYATLGPTIDALPAYSVIEFGAWPQLYQFEVRIPIKDVCDGATPKTRTVRPDGFLRVQPAWALRHPYIDCFLEVDRGSESLATLETKAAHYKHHYDSHHYAQQFGYAGASRKLFPFRVLFVLESAERRNNLCDRLIHRRPSAATWLWLTTLSELLAQPLGSIWIRPFDYHRSVAETPFDPTLKQPTRHYIRDPLRDAYIDRHVPKRAFFDGYRPVIHKPASPTRATIQSFAGSGAIFNPSARG